MSYDIYLKDPSTGSPIEFSQPHTLTGGTYQVGGSTEAWLNVTWNYSKFFYDAFGEKGIRALYGKTAKEASLMICEAIVKIGPPVPSEDYWAATPGNASMALYNLLTLCAMAPEGVFDGD